VFLSEVPLYSRPVLAQAVLRLVHSGTSLIRNRPPLEPYNRALPRALWRSQVWRGVLMSEKPMYHKSYLTPSVFVHVQGLLEFKDTHRPWEGPMHLAIDLP
jgi:hypothetical protein